MPRVCIDFDGTIHPYTKGWTGEVPEPEPPTDGAENALWEYLREGYSIAIHTTRATTDDGKRGVEAWLITWMPHISVDLLPRVGENEARIVVTDKKLPAVAYVDDRAVVFRGSWTDVHTDVTALARRH